MGSLIPTGPMGPHFEVPLLHIAQPRFFCVGWRVVLVHAGGEEELGLVSRVMYMARLSTRSSTRFP